MSATTGPQKPPGMSAIRKWREHLQHKGVLADNMRQYGRAVDLYKQVLRLFQAASDDASIMRTSKRLGAVEHVQGRLSEAKTWYERSREIARRRGDTEATGTASHNIGLVCREGGEVARQRRDEATVRQRFAEAEHFLHESLRIQISLQNKPCEAMARDQLPRLYLLTAELDKAEAHAHQARGIDEGLGLIRHLPHDYYSLAQIAHARGDETQAAYWEARRGEVEVELARRARGDAAADAGR